MYKKIFKFLVWLGSVMGDREKKYTKRHEGVNQKEIDKQNKKPPKVNYRANYENK